MYLPPVSYIVQFPHNSKLSSLNVGQTHLIAGLKGSKTILTTSSVLHSTEQN